MTVRRPSAYQSKEPCIGSIWLPILAPQEPSPCSMLSAYFSSCMFPLLYELRARKLQHAVRSWTQPDNEAFLGFISSWTQPVKSHLFLVWCDCNGRLEYSLTQDVHSTSKGGGSFFFFLSSLPEILPLTISV